MRWYVLCSLFGVCFSHVPIFPGDREPLYLGAEPSRAYYYRSGTPITFTVNFVPNDEQYVSVLRPYRGGIGGKRDTSNSVTIVNLTTLCVEGEATLSSHNKYNSPGEVYDEPYTVTSYAYVETLMYGHRSNVTQSCTWRVETDNVPFVIVVGTKENFVNFLGYNVPELVMRLSAWNNNYVYGWLFLVILVFLLGLSTISYVRYNLSLSILGCISIGVTVLQLLFQLEPFGWCRASIGLLVLLLYAYTICVFLYLHFKRNDQSFQKCTKLLLFIIVFCLVMFLPWFSKVTMLLVFIQAVVIGYEELYMYRYYDNVNPYKW